MTNYLKSELYRIARSKGIYCLVGGCSALVLAMNLILWYFGTFTEGFPYATTRFSFGMSSMDMQLPMCLTVVMSSIIFADEYKNRTISNSVAFGLSTVKVLLGKWMVTLFVSAVAMIIVEGVLVGSGYLLLENSGRETLMDLLKANQACIPLFIVGVSGYIAFTFLLKNETQAIWAWAGTMIGVDVVVSLLAMKFQFFQWLAGWLVYSMVSVYEINEETGEMFMLWQMAGGMQKTLWAGILGTVVFLLIGIMGARSKNR